MNKKELLSKFKSVFYRPPGWDGAAGLPKELTVHVPNSNPICEVPKCKVKKKLSSVTFYTGTTPTIDTRIAVCDRCYNILMTMKWRKEHENIKSFLKVPNTKVTKFKRLSIPDLPVIHIPKLKTKPKAKAKAKAKRQTKSTRILAKYPICELYECKCKRRPSTKTFCFIAETNRIAVCSRCFGVLMGMRYRGEYNRLIEIVSSVIGHRSKGY